MTSNEEDFGAFFESLLEGESAASRLKVHPSPAFHSAYLPLQEDDESLQQPDKPLLDQQSHCYAEPPEEKEEKGKQQAKYASDLQQQEQRRLSQSSCGQQQRTREEQQQPDNVDILTFFDDIANSSSHGRNEQQHPLHVQVSSRPAVSVNTAAAVLQNREHMPTKPAAATSVIVQRLSTTAAATPCDRTAPARTHMSSESATAALSVLSEAGGGSQGGTAAESSAAANFAVGTAPSGKGLTARSGAGTGGGPAEKEEERAASKSPSVGNRRKSLLSGSIGAQPRAVLSSESIVAASSSVFTPTLTTHLGTAAALPYAAAAASAAYATAAAAVEGRAASSKAFSGREDVLLQSAEWRPTMPHTHHSSTEKSDGSRRSSDGDETSGIYSSGNDCLSRSSSDSVSLDPTEAQQRTGGKHATVKSHRAPEDVGAVPASATAAAATGRPASPVQEQKQRRVQQQITARSKRAAPGDLFLQELCQPPGRKTRKIVLPQLGSRETQQRQQQQQQAKNRWWTAPPELDLSPPYRFSMIKMMQADGEQDLSRSSTSESRSSSSSTSSRTLCFGKFNDDKRSRSSTTTDSRTETCTRGGLGTAQQDMAFSAEAVSRVIEAKLLENQQMIFAIHENLTAGGFEQAVGFFERLQQNLLFLALLADQQPEQQLGKVTDVQQQGQRESGDNFTGEQQDLHGSNVDFWSHEETQRLYHALRTPYLDLRQLSAAVCTKDSQQVLSYLLRTADTYLNYSRGIPGQGYSMQYPAPRQNLRSHSQQARQRQQMQVTSSSRGESHSTMQTSIPLVHSKLVLAPHLSTMHNAVRHAMSESSEAPLSEKQSENVTSGGPRSPAASGNIYKNVRFMQPDPAGAPTTNSI